MPSRRVTKIEAELAEDRWEEFYQLLRRTNNPATGKKLSIAAFAEIIGVKPSSISNVFLRQVGSARIETAVAIFLGVPHSDVWPERAEGELSVEEILALENKLSAFKQL